MELRGGVRHQYSNQLWPRHTYQEAADVWERRVKIIRVVRDLKNSHQSSARSTPIPYFGGGPIARAILQILWFFPQIRNFLQQRAWEIHYWIGSTGSKREMVVIDSLAGLYCTVTLPKNMERFGVIASRTAVRCRWSGPIIRLFALKAEIKFFESISSFDGVRCLLFLSVVNRSTYFAVIFQRQRQPFVAFSQVCFYFYPQLLSPFQLMVMSENFALATLFDRQFDFWAFNLA